ncbi:Uncharacterized protein DBV15_11812 [Temnothorax longispinosus]|uniref:Uncharacterized protein n=1 Tax=Temnothorax longispinosus TaxID=300112 RepID=A0A4S2K8G6_9HYME|nr:Uncharacterized protein DBV15_11812 [Temnothorax longispinosus]
MKHLNMHFFIAVETDTVASSNVEEDTATTAISHTDLDETRGQQMRWSHEAVLLLLEEYRQQEQDMYTGKISHKKAWEQLLR